MSATGTLEVIAAARMLLMSDSILDAQGVFWGSAEHESDLPYVIIAVQSNVPSRGLNAPNKARTIGLMAKSCAKESGRSAQAIAGEMQERAVVQLTQTIGGVTAKERWNAALAGTGWIAQTPLERSEVPAYMDNIGDVERWHLGNTFDIRITKS